MPAYKCDVFDVSGAGDTVVAVAAATLATGRSAADAMTLANLAASVVVGKSGTATLCPGEFIRAAVPVSSETSREGMSRLVTKHFALALPMAVLIFFTPVTLPCLQPPKSVVTNSLWQLIQMQVLNC